MPGAPLSLYYPTWQLEFASILLCSSETVPNLLLLSLPFALATVLPLPAPFELNHELLSGDVNSLPCDFRLAVLGHSLSRLKQQDMVQYPGTIMVRVEIKCIVLNNIKRMLKTLLNIYS